MVGEVARGLSLFGGASSEVRRCNWRRAEACGLPTDPFAVSTPAQIDHRATTTRAGDGGEARGGLTRIVLDGIVLDLVQRVDVRANGVPWLQSRDRMRAPIPAASARVRTIVLRLHAAAVLHLAAGRLLPQARLALDESPHL